MFLPGCVDCRAAARSDRRGVRKLISSGDKMKFNRLFVLIAGAIGATAGCRSVEIATPTAEFASIVPATSRVFLVAGGMTFTEGPVWRKERGGYLVFSDIPANELKQWSEKAGLRTFRPASNNANGNTMDQRGRLVTAEHSARRISVTESNGTVTTVVDRYNGARFNSPNDVVVKSDGTIWFTDPPYGLPKDEAKEQPGNFVYRFDPKSKETSVVVRDIDMPNGLCFSPDEKLLYVADSGKTKRIYVFDVGDGGVLTGSRVFAVIDQGGPDGIRCDSKGRLYSSAGDGVHVFSTNGVRLGRIIVPETPANLAFGGDDMKTLYITARKSLYAIRLNTTGRQ